MMKFLKLFEKNKYLEPKTAKKIYKDAIEKKIRLRYDQSDEFALLRKKEIGEDLEEFAEYSAYVKQCIAEVKEEYNLPFGVIW